MSGIEGKKGYYLQKTGARVNELLERHYIVPTFTTSPTEDTLSWDDEGHIVYFRVGEIIRVKTSEGYDFYRVNDIKDNKINWVKIDTPSDTYTKDEIDVKFFTKEDASGYISEKLVNYYSKREVDGKIEQTNKSVLEQTERVDNLGVELKNKASAEQVNKLENGLETTKRSIAEQTTKVTALQSEIKTKASTQSVTQLGDSVNIISDTVAEQTIRTDELEASIETKVSQEVFDAATGDINSEFIAVKQTTDAIETTVKSQSGEITAINESVNGLSISLGTIESELGSLRNQMDGTTESYFEKWIPTNENEPAKTWIEEGKEEEHKGDTFTNTSLDGEGAGKSWRWLQDDNGNWGWQPIADTDALKALEAAAKAQAAADGKVTIYYEQPSNYKEGDIWFVHNNSYSPYKQGEILSAKTENTLFSISDWESKTRYTQAVEDLNDVMITTFKDGVLTEAERISIIESITSIANEQAAVQARYNIIIINANLTDETLKNEFKATKVAYDTACNNLINIVEQIADAKAENLESLFDNYTQLSDAYSEAYADHNEKESEINNALMGRLNPANVYIDNITDDGILTPIEKEQLFEIYRSIAREYDATRSNAFNYKVWKYSNDGVTEESGLNGGEGRYNNYIAFKSAYNNVASVFSSSIWGFTQMKESTTLPEGYTTTLLKSYLDAYYESYGILTESFSAITAAIEAAQKATEATLKGLTDNLLPEEMSTTVGKGVVLSTIIATKDVEGKVTAGMNASSAHSNPEHGRVVFVGGAKDISDFNNAPYVVYEDGHVKMESADIAAYASRVEMYTSLASKADVSSFNEVVDAVNTLKNMWRFEDIGGTLVLKSEYDVLTNGQFAAATVGAEGGGSVGAAYLADLYDVSLGSLLSGDILSWNGSEWVNIKQSSLVPDLSGYLPKSGGTIDSTSWLPLVINSSFYDGSVAIQLSSNGVTKAGVVYNSEGAYIYNYSLGYYLGISDSGHPNYNGHTLYHTGNFNPSDYLPLAGGTISGILTINDLSSANPFIYFQANGSTRAGVGYYSDYGTYIYNAASGTILGIKDDGTPHYNMSTIIHSGNVGDYAFVPRTQIINNTDADTLLTNGVYLNAIGNGSGNSNFPSAYSTFLTFAQENRYAAQLSVGDGYLHFRRKIDTWSNWYEVIHSGNVGSQSVAYATHAGLLYESDVLDFVPQDSLTVKGWYNWGNPTGDSFTDYTHGIVMTSPDVNICSYIGFGHQFGEMYVRTIDYGTDSGWKTIAFTDSNVASADVVAKTYANDNINYNRNESRIRLISGYASNSEDLGFPAQYVSGISVLTNYTGWQMVSYGSSAVPNPYYRAFYDNGTRGDWKKLAFLDDNVASAQALKHSNGTVGATVSEAGNLSIKRKISSADDSLNLFEYSAGFLYLGYSLRNEYITRVYGNKIEFLTGDTQRIVINSSGNVTIGSGDLAGTSAKLYVDGDIYTSAHVISNGYFYMTDTQGSVNTAIDKAGDTIIFGYGFGIKGYDTHYTGYNVHIEAGGGWKTGKNISLLHNGNVLIGTTTDSGYKLDVAGNVGFGTTGGCDVYLKRTTGFNYINAAHSFAVTVNNNTSNIAMYIEADKATTFDGTLRVTDTLTAQNGVVTNEITIGGIKLDVSGGALRVNGDIFSTGQFAASVAGEATGGSNIVLDYASIVNALGYTPANNNNLAQVAFTGSYSSLSGTPDVYTKADVYNKNEINQKLAGVGGGGGSVGSTFGIDYINGQVFNMPNGVNCITSYSEATVDFSSIEPVDQSLPCIVYIVKCDYHTLHVTSNCRIVSVNSSGDEVYDFSINGMTGMMLVWDPDIWRWVAYLQK